MIYYIFFFIQQINAIIFFCHETEQREKERRFKVPKFHKSSQEKHQLCVELPVNHLIKPHERLPDNFDLYVHHQNIIVGFYHQDIQLDDLEYHNHHLKRQQQHMNKNHVQMDQISIE